MATLEKIRSKSVLLIIVIGVALLAFIVGDALTNSRNLFGEGNVVAKVGGNKIDIQEYQNKVEELNKQLEQARQQNPAQVANFDTQLISQMAVDQLVDEKLLKDAADKLGIHVTGDMLNYYMIKNPINQRLRDLLQSMNQNGMAVQTPEQAYEIIFNPKRNGKTDKEMAPYQRMWVSIEQETKDLIKQHIYQRVLVATIQPNDLEKKAMHDDYVSTKQIKLAQVPYGNLDEKKYPVSDADLKAAYENEKNMFKVNEPTKYVGFISVTVAPSAADQNESKALAQKVAGDLRKSGQLSKEVKNKGVTSNQRQVRASDLAEGALKNFVASAPKDSVSVVMENIQGFTVVKMGERTSEIDSIQINLVQVAGDKLPARVLAALNGGVSVDSIAKKFSADSVGVQKEQWIPLFAEQGRTNAIEPAMLDSLRSAGGNFVTLMTQQGQGAVLGQIVKQTAPKDIYTFEEASFTLQPGSKTLQDAEAKLQKFLDQNNNATAFMKNAGKAGYTPQQVELSQSSAAVPMAGGMEFYPESRQVVRWVMIDADKGDVSHIYTSNADIARPVLYAAAVIDEYDNFRPLSNKDVKEYLTTKVRRSKAGDDMVKKYKGSASSMEAVAKAMGVEPRDMESFRFGMQGGVPDAPVLGKIAGSKKGGVVVVKGDNGVYAFQILGEKKENFPYNDDNYKQQYMQSIRPDFSRMLRGNKKVKNNVYKFQSGD